MAKIQFFAQITDVSRKKIFTLLVIKHELNKGTKSLYT